ncbi:hypothetical protein KKH27_08940 [bacterium]|nr:hypothetical protein [bacterium]MBU1984742.1 hypothetical protein [bacterium]
MLDVIESKDEGPYYPHVAARLDETGYRFFAGRVAGEKSFSDLPVGHPVASRAAEDWQFEGDEPGGSWIALKYDRQRDVISIASDVFLFQRWYYSHIGGRWYFSNSLMFLHHVADPKPPIEERSVPYMLLLNYLPERYTPLKDVFSVRPGQCLTVRDGVGVLEQRVALPFERTADEVFAGEDPNALKARIVGEALSVLREAVASELEGLSEITIPISGGMDSRFMLGCALEGIPRDRITTYTYGRPSSRDFQIGIGLAQSLGLRNLKLPMDLRPLEQILKDGFFNSEGMKLAIQNSPLGPQREVLPPGTHVLSGFLGDTMWGVEDIKRARDLAVHGDMGEHLVRLVLARALTTSVAEVQPLLTTENWDVLNYREAIRALPGATLEERYSRWYALDRDTNRVNFGIQVHRDRAFYLAPNVHARVVRFAHGMPVQLRRAGIAYFNALKSGFPELYNFPTTRNFGYPLERDVHWRRRILRRWGMAISQIERIVFRCSGELFYYPAMGHQYAHPLEYHKKRYRADVLRCLEEVQPMSILDPRGIAKLRDAYDHRRYHSAQLVKALVTIQQWQKYYRNDVSGGRR